MQASPTLQISLPGKHCRCGAIRARTDRRCPKCQARGSWYRHNCQHPQRRVLRAHRGRPGHGGASTRACGPGIGHRAGQQTAAGTPPPPNEGR